VELRLQHLHPDALEAAMRQADEAGYILVRPFVTQLAKFEKDEPAMSYYFPDLIAGISVDAEQKRFKDFVFAPADSTFSSDAHHAPAPPSELDRRLAEGDREIANKDAAAATATFQAVLAKYPDEPRALYGMAIAAVLSGRADEARGLFERIVSLENSSGHSPQKSAIDPGILAWSHVYLGRIHDLEDEREPAMKEYRAALGIEGAPEAARAAAQSGVESAYKAPERPGQSRPTQP
jgi:tetratricopeptide (TPR) repeat protein